MSSVGNFPRLEDRTDGEPARHSGDSQVLRRLADTPHADTSD